MYQFIVYLVLCFLALPVYSQETMVNAVVEQIDDTVVVEIPVRTEQKEVVADSSVVEKVNLPVPLKPSPVQKVLLEAKVYQIVLNDEHTMGVDWEASVDDYFSLPFQSPNLKPRSVLYSHLSFGTINKEDVDLLIEALDTVGAIRPLSGTQVVTKPKGKARFYVGLSEPYVITMTTNLPLDKYGEEYIFLNDMGVQFHFQPSIEFETDVSVVIRPDQNLFQGKSKPEDIRMRVSDGNTIVIGGMLKEEKLERLRKIPLLGDLPILGFAFRNPNQATRTTEFVLFLTPKIVTENE